MKNNITPVVSKSVAGNTLFYCFNALLQIDTSANNQVKKSCGPNRQLLFLLFTPYCYTVLTAAVPECGWQRIPRQRQGVLLSLP